MKPITLDKKSKKTILRRFLKELSAAMEGYDFSEKSEFSFKLNVGRKLKEKIQIVYSPSAYLRMEKLVDSFDSEVGWYGLVQRKSNKLYYVYDVLVPKQQVNGAKVDTTDEDTLEFFSNLTDEQAEDLKFQAHSHVNFDTSASGTDKQNQLDVISNIPGKQGFYLFQIWNKRGSISTYLYDLDENAFYDKEDVELQIEDERFGTLDLFAEEAKKNVSAIKPNVTKWSGTYANTGYQYDKKDYAGSHYQDYAGYHYGCQDHPDYAYGHDSSRFLNGVPDYDAYESGYSDEFWEEVERKENELSEKL